jgi:hypothetical protein
VQCSQCKKFFCPQCIGDLVADPDAKHVQCPLCLLVAQNLSSDFALSLCDGVASCIACWERHNCIFFLNERGYIYHKTLRDRQDWTDSETTAYFASPAAKGKSGAFRFETVEQKLSYPFDTGDETLTSITYSFQGNCNVRILDMFKSEKTSYTRSANHCLGEDRRHGSVISLYKDFIETNLRAPYLLYQRWNKDFITDSHFQRMWMLFDPAGWGGISAHVSSQRFRSMFGAGWETKTGKKMYTYATEQGPDEMFGLSESSALAFDRALKQKQNVRRVLTAARVHQIDIDMQYFGPDMNRLVTNCLFYPHNDYLIAHTDIHNEYGFCPDMIATFSMGQETELRRNATSGSIIEVQPSMSLSWSVRDGRFPVHKGLGIVRTTADCVLMQRPGTTDTMHAVPPVTGSIFNAQFRKANEQCGILKWKKGHLKQKKAQANKRKRRKLTIQFV